MGTMLRALPLQPSASSCTACAVKPIMYCLRYLGSVKWEELQRDFEGRTVVSIKMVSGQMRAGTGSLTTVTRYSVSLTLYPWKLGPLGSAVHPGWLALPITPNPHLCCLQVQRWILGRPDIINQLIEHGIWTGSEQYGSVDHIIPWSLEGPE